jgi:hypothetical protein
MSLAGCCSQLIYPASAFPHCMGLSSHNLGWLSHLDTLSGETGRFIPRRGCHKCIYKGSIEHYRFQVKIVYEQVFHWPIFRKFGWVYLTILIDWKCIAGFPLDFRINYSLLGFFITSSQSQILVQNVVKKLWLAREPCIAKRQIMFTHQLTSLYHMDNWQQDIHFVAIRDHPKSSRTEWSGLQIVRNYMIKHFRHFLHIGWTGQKILILTYSLRIFMARGNRPVIGAWLSRSVSIYECF